MTYHCQTAKERGKKIYLMLVRKVFTLQKRFQFHGNIYGTVILHEITYQKKIWPIIYKSL